MNISKKKISSLIFIFTLLSWISNNPANAVTLVLPLGSEGKDAALAAHRPDDNLGNIPGHVWGSFGSINGMRYINQFDLSAIPKGANIISANLTMTAWANFNATHQYNAHLHRLTESWDESTVTYNSWSNPGGTFAEEWASTIFTMPGGTPKGSDATLPVNFDITDLVKAWNDDVFPNYGFILVPETLKIDPSGSPTNNYTSWSHYEAMNQKLRPKITIEYESVPEGSTILSLLSTSGIILLTYKFKKK